MNLGLTKASRRRRTAELAALIRQDPDRTAATIVESVYWSYAAGLLIGAVVGVLLAHLMWRLGW